MKSYRKAECPAVIGGWRIMGLLVALLIGVPAGAETSLSGRVEGKSFPAIFQAWNPVDMTNQFPLTTLEQRLRAAAKHGLLWEEPVSQLGFNTPLVLGAVWDHPHGGLATDFTVETKRQALANRKRLLELNPNMVLLLEVRWRDAPGSFLPEDSPFWKRNADGTRKKGWDGGPEPYYLMNPENPDFAANIARQCKIAVDSGIYDGVMFDWDGFLPIVKKTREILGDNALIICNIHDRIKLGEQYKGLINGAFMELNQEGPGITGRKLGTWESSRKALLYFEENFAKPTVNCFESWGERKDVRRMRVATTLALTHSDGYVLYADPNPLKTPDHLHDWYPFWDAPLGKPAGKLLTRGDGAYQREFTSGTVIYNPISNKPVTVRFDEQRKRASDGTSGKEFTVNDYDGEIFLKVR
jgi:hypothetical protein